MGSANPPIKTILVVEDEPLLRMMAFDMVEEAGFEALEAANAAQALAMLKARPDIQLVFSDIDMPGGMNGVSLAQAIGDLWPAVRVILTSGKFTSDQVQIPHFMTFFPKPYRIDRVVDEMRRLTA